MRWVCDLLVLNLYLYISVCVCVSSVDINITRLKINGREETYNVKKSVTSYLNGIQIYWKVEQMRQETIVDQEETG